MLVYIGLLILILIIVLIIWEPDVEVVVIIMATILGICGIAYLNKDGFYKQEEESLVDAPVVEKTDLSGVSEPDHPDYFNLEEDIPEDAGKVDSNTYEFGMFDEGLDLDAKNAMAMQHTAQATIHAGRTPDCDARWEYHKRIYLPGIERAAKSVWYEESSNFTNKTF